MNRVIKYDFLRIFACLNIILLHVASSYLVCIPVESKDFTIMTVYDCLTRFAVPVFMMLSGAFLLKPTEKNILRDSWSRLFKMIVVFFVWSAFYAFQSYGINLVKGTATNEMLHDALERFQYGHYHMWFLFLIMEFYLFRPLLYYICKDIRIMKYFLVLWIALRFILPLLQLTPVLAWTMPFISRFELNMITGWMGYFILGYYLTQKEFPKKIRAILYALGCCGFFATILLTYFTSQSAGEYNGSYCSPSSLTVLPFATAVFLAFRYSKMECEKYAGMIGKLSGCTLTVYMVHPFFLEKLGMIGLSTISFTPILSIPVIWIIAAILSFGTAIVIEMILSKLKPQHRK